MEYKIVFTGGVGAGKTTAIRTISDIDVVATEARAADAHDIGKTDTTVAMDYGYLDLSQELRLHLYGTPGQERFDFMWEILSQGAMGFIIIVSNRAQDPLQDARLYLRRFEAAIRRCGSCAILGVSHMDVSLTPPRRAYVELVQEMRLPIPVLELDPRQSFDLRSALAALAAQIEIRTAYTGARHDRELA